MTFRTAPYTLRRVTAEATLWRMMPTIICYKIGIRDCDCFFKNASYFMRNMRPSQIYAKEQCHLTEPINALKNNAIDTNLWVFLCLAQCERKKVLFQGTSINGVDVSETRMIKCAIFIIFTLISHKKIQVGVLKRNRSTVGTWC